MCSAFWDSPIYYLVKGLALIIFYLDQITLMYTKVILASEASLLMNGTIQPQLIQIYIKKETVKIAEQIV